MSKRVTLEELLLDQKLIKKRYLNFINSLDHIEIGINLFEELFLKTSQTISIFLKNDIILNFKDILEFISKNNYINITPGVPGNFLENLLSLGLLTQNFYTIFSEINFKFHSDFFKQIKLFLPEINKIKKDIFEKEKLLFENFQNSLINLKIKRKFIKKNQNNLINYHQKNQKIEDNSNYLTQLLIYKQSIMDEGSALFELNSSYYHYVTTLNNFFLQIQNKITDFFKKIIILIPIIGNNEFDISLIMKSIIDRIILIDNFKDFDNFIKFHKIFRQNFKSTIIKKSINFHDSNLILPIKLLFNYQKPNCPNFFGNIQGFNEKFLIYNNISTSSINLVQNSLTKKFYFINSKFINIINQNYGIVKSPIFQNSIIIESGTLVIILNKIENKYLCQNINDLNFYIPQSKLHVF